VNSYIALSYWDLAAASVLVFINAGLSVIFRLRLHRSLLIAAIRMAAPALRRADTDKVALHIGQPA
jgi:ABC-type iron transport system FetAB permease component